ncbi:MAG: PKD domain-containing protein [Candidatus Limnocylindrales bacterium]
MKGVTSSIDVITFHPPTREPLMRSFTNARHFRRRPRSRGQSLVEFALILPIMLLFLAAVVDLGRVFYATISLNNAAREGAFQAAQTPDSYQSGQACNTATNLVVCRVQLESKDSSVSIAPSDISLSCGTPGCPEQAGSTVTVAVQGQFQLITPLLSMIFGGQTIPMSAQATALLEYFPPANTATLPPPPVAVMTSSSSGLTVSFDASGSSSNPTEWNWDFGDGNTSIDGPTVSHTYAVAGTYTVTLTVINLAGTDDTQSTVTVGAPATASPTSSGTPSPTPTSTPTPFNCYPPNVIGLAPGTASADLINAGFSVVSLSDLTTGQKGKIQSQNPDHTQCLSAGAQITIRYRPN